MSSKGQLKAAFGNWKNQNKRPIINQSSKIKIEDKETDRQDDLTTNHHKKVLKKKKFEVYLPPDMAKKIKIQAVMEGISMSEYAERIFSKALSN
mgnify:CR=1 FL=1